MMNLSLDTKPILSSSAGTGVNENSSSEGGESNPPDQKILLNTVAKINHDPEGANESLYQEQYENRSGLSKFLINNQKRLNDLAMKLCYGGITLHGTAAFSPFLKLIPKPLSDLFEKTATLYSRFVSGLPFSVFAIEDHKDKNIIPLIAKLSSTFSFPLIETVENMPVASSLFCGINTALDAIEDYKGEKVKRKTNSIFHQIEEFVINYSRTWKDSLSKFRGKGSLMDKYKSFFNMVSLPGYTIVHVLGMFLCRNRIAESDSNSFKNKVAIGTRTLRAILGIATDFFLLDSKEKSKRTIGATYIASSIFSLVPPWANVIFKGKSQENIDNLINVFGQTCKSLDELANALWAKAKQINNPSNSNEKKVRETYNDYSFEPLPV